MPVQLPDHIASQLGDYGWLTPEQEQEADAAIALAKEQLRARCDRSRPEPGVEIREIAIRDCGIRGGY